MSSEKEKPVYKRDDAAQSDEKNETNRRKKKKKKSKILKIENRHLE